MNRRILVNLLLLLSFAAAAVAEPPPAFCVRVFVADRDGSHSMGSGTLLAPTLIVTNYHVVKDAKSQAPIKILFPDWSIKAGKVIKVDRQWDIAAVVIPRVDVKPATIGEVPKKGDRLTVHGYGMGLPASSTGILDDFKMKSRNSAADIVDIKGAKVRQGDSGGPILNEKGEYVGTLFGGGPGYTMGTHVGRVKIILGDLLKQKDWYNLTIERK